jgi:hypothetical protein
VSSGEPHPDAQTILAASITLIRRTAPSLDDPTVTIGCCSPTRSSFVLGDDVDRVAPLGDESVDDALRAEPDVDEVVQDHDQHVDDRTFEDGDEERSPRLAC